MGRLIGPSIGPSRWPWCVSLALPTTSLSAMYCRRFRCERVRLMVVDAIVGDMPNGTFWANPCTGNQNGVDRQYSYQDYYSRY
jgi:hypothetical protein